jgi:Domain of unknown function (DUF4440)
MTIEDDVRATSAAMFKALTSNDASLVAGLMTDDWVHVAATGVTPKSDIIEWVASGRLVHHSLTVLDARLMRVADAVLVITRRASSGSWDGTRTQEPGRAPRWNRPSPHGLSRRRCGPSSAQCACGERRREDDRAARRPVGLREVHHFLLGLRQSVVRGLLTWRRWFVMPSWMHRPKRGGSSRARWWRRATVAAMAAVAGTAGLVTRRRKAARGDQAVDPKTAPVDPGTGPDDGAGAGGEAEIPDGRPGQA